MSAIEDTVGGALGSDGIRRYHTTCKIRVDSHNNKDPIYLSENVQSINISKSVKGQGIANISLVAAENYLNLIFPDDYINIYFDLGDGNGWTRTFFGFVDRIEEFYEVNQSGAPTTRYQLMCSDFYKAFERTMIYFNPHLAGRPDFDGSFIGTPNIGGLALMTKGIKVTGSPADIVQNNALLMLGFGSQFLLPGSYPRNLVTELRGRREEFATGRLREDIRNAVIDAGSYEAFREAVISRTEGIAEETAGQYSNPADRVSHLREQYNIPAEDFESVDPADTVAVARVLQDAALRNLLREEHNVAGDFDQGVRNILDSSTAEFPPSLLDVVDVFSFVERPAIDGYAADMTIWQKTSSVGSLLRSYSHEPINELLIDLRPVDSGAGVYSREPDDVLENAADAARPAGIRYVPALVMREYPFSTIEGLDLRDVSVGLEGQEGFSRNIGVVFFGNIFSDRPNIPGRHYVTMPSISWEDRAAGNTNALATKHMDVAVVSEQEIIRSQLGRSDNEHFNLFEFYSDAINGVSQRYFMNDLLPIITPVHILRHGLRVRSITTRFTRFSLPVARRSREAPEEEKAVAIAAEEVAAPTVPSNPLIPADPNIEDIPDNRYFNALRTIAAAYGVGLNVYMLARTMHSELSRNVGDSLHPGYYIPAITAVNIARSGIRVGGRRRAFPKRDGTRSYSTTNVALAFTPDGGAANRSQGFLRFPGDKRTYEDTIRAAEHGTYSLHLTTEQQAQVTQYFSVAQMVLDGVLADPTPGAAITYEHSREEGTTRTDAGGTGANLPLGPSTSEITTRSEFPYSQSLYVIPSPPEKTPGIRTSVFYTTRDIEHISGSGSYTINRDEENDPAAVVTPAEDMESVAIDSALTREQIIRWALLQDHWYQHNLEYLSGRIDMRGAPEIRVGYRLDLKERNMSFYIENVTHSWSFPDKMTTTLQVTRGQPNNPYPGYVLPKIESMHPTPSQRISGKSRLATYFVSPDPIAVRRSMVLNRLDPKPQSTLTGAGGDQNFVDNAKSGIDPLYDEFIVGPSSRIASAALEQEQLERDLAEGLREFDTQEGLSSITGTDPTSAIDPEDPLRGLS